jgi:hypothetical protein
MVKHLMTDREILAQIPEARARAEAAKTSEPHASAARYDRRRRLLNVSLTNGGSFSLPVGAIPALESATDEQLASVELGPYGVALHWESLDADVSVAGLAQTLFGTRTLMRVAGASGGASKSEAKVQAARLNGLKGGRPKALPSSSANRRRNKALEANATAHRRIASAVREAEIGGAKNEGAKRNRQTLGDAISKRPAKKR